VLRGYVILTATPTPGSILVGWCGSSCSATTSTTCTVALGASPQSFTAEFALTGIASIDITFAGNATGEVKVHTDAGDTMCFGACSVTATPGTWASVTAATPSDFAGCTGMGCGFTTIPGSNPVTVTFTSDPKQLWTRLPFSGESFVAAAFDASENLIAATSAHLVKLDPLGTTLWTRAFGGAVAIAPDD